MTVTTGENLDARISQTLRDTGMDSVAAADVLAALDAEAAALTGDIAEARKDALSPLLDTKAAAKVKASLDGLTFRQDRLAAARVALVVRVEELRASEQMARLNAEREAALAERDALAAVIRDEIPALTRRYAEIIRELDASDARLSSAGLVFESAEIVARGYQGNGVWQDGRGQVTRLRNAKLPLLDRPGLAWADDGMNARTIWAALES